MRGFSLGLEFWSAESGETAAGVRLREILHNHLDEMTPAQRAELVKLDAQAAELFARHNGQPDPFCDIRALGDFVRIADSERTARAA